VTRPRLGFLGVGWIGRHRMEAIADQRCAEIAAIADPSRERLDAALGVVPGAVACEHLGQLLELPLDGIVVATPSALHKEHCLAALARGRAVFCQKPLARTANETRRVVEAARSADRLLGVDLSYRFTSAMQQIRQALHAGSIGRVFAVDLTFHNAYGPDAAWFYDKSASGGGCVIDLGIHLVDLAMWLLDFPVIDAASSRLYAAGEPITAGSLKVEDYAIAELRAGDTVIRLACSWRISAGRDAVIEASLYGTEGALALKNIDGSFYDFAGERYTGTHTDRLASPPDAWGGRAAIAWTERLAAGARFDPEAERLIDVATVLDAIYRGRVK
jgi:predicted dehydrogenase